MSLTETWTEWASIVEAAGPEGPNIAADRVRNACAAGQWSDLPALAGSAAVWTIVDPDRAIAFRDLGNVITTSSAFVGDQAHVVLAMLDLLNVVSCVGGDFSGKAALVAQIPALARRPPTTVAARLRLAAAALVHRETEAYESVVGRGPRVDEAAVRTRPSDILRYLAAETVGGNGEPPAWPYFLDRCDELRREAIIDAETLLWLARIAYRGQVSPPGAARTLNTRLREIVRGEELVFQQRRYQTGNPHDSGEAPFTETIGGGQYRITDHVAGVGRWRMYLGESCSPPRARVLISMVEGHQKIVDADLRRELAHPFDGVLPLVFIGAFDPPHDPARQRAVADWGVLVEALPAGQSARAAVTTALPAALAARLVASVGTIVERAARRGVFLTHIRPETIWLSGATDPMAVGVSGRAGVFFNSRTFGEFPSLLPFPRAYAAPEADSRPSDRAVVFTLGALLAQWTTGRHPFAREWKATGRRYFSTVSDASSPDLAGMPAALAALASLALAPRSEDRPPLASFLAELERRLGAA